MSQSLSDSECASIHGFERSGAGWVHCEGKTISCLVNSKSPTDEVDKTSKRLFVDISET